jgi:hypothetical protein
MPGPTDVQPTPSFSDNNGEKKQEQQKPAEQARENLALLAWAKPEDKPAAPTERKVFAKIEGVEDWEQVEKNAGKKANYLDLRQNIVTLLPYMQIENAQGKAEDDFKTALVQLFDKEKNDEVRAKLRTLLESVPGESRDKLLKDLKGLYKDEAKIKIVDGMSATEELRANERDMIDKLQTGVRAADVLQKLAKDDLPKEGRQRLVDELKEMYKNDPEKSKLLKELKDGDEGKKQLGELLKTIEKENYMATMATYPTVARFIDVASRQSAAQFQDMKIGDTTDVRAENRFPEGAPFLRPSLDGRPVSWDLYLTKVRQGETPCTVTPKLEGLLSDDRTAAFTNATDWLNKSQSVIAGIERKYDVQETWRRLQTDFHAPESWAPPSPKDARALDAWFNAANTVRREVTSLRDYVQAYLDLKEVTPDLRDKTIKDLKAKGYEIEWDELSHKLTKFKPPVPEDLRILSPKVDSLVKEWQNTRRELAEPIDKILETYAKGDKNFLKHGTFTGPADRGFLLMENNKIKFVVESEEIKKEDAKKKLDESKEALKALEEAKPKLEADLAKDKKSLEDGFKNKTDLTKLETEEKAALDLKVRKLEGEVEANKVAIERAKEKVARCEEQKDGGKFPGRVISYVRNVDGTEEVIDRNMEGRFVTKKGVDVSDEVDYKPEKFTEKNRVKFDYINYTVTTETAKGADGKDIIGTDGKPEVRINTKRDFMGDHMVNFYHQFGSTEASLSKAEDHNTNDYMGVISNVTGKIRFLRADDIGGFFGWKAGQNWNEGLSLAANVTMDVAMIYLGGAGLYSGIAKRAFGEAALGAMRMAVGLSGFPFGPALRQSDWGQEALKWRHRAMMFDVFVLGLGGGALNLLRGTKAAAETVTLADKVAHYAMLSTTAVYGPEIMADIYHKMQLVKGEAPIQCAQAAGNDIAIRSKNLDRLSKPYDFKDVQVRKATGDMLESYQSTLLNGVTDDKVKTNIQSMIAATKKNLDPASLAAEKEALKRKLVDSITDFDPRKKATQSEKAAAVACLILLNTDEKGGVNEKLARNYSYKDALKLLRTQVSDRKGTGAETEAVRLVAADRLANLKDPETGKPALPPRQLAAVCMQIAENAELPESLRQRALFDPSRPRLGFLMNELEAEEQSMNMPGVGAAEKQAFLGNINGFHSDDIKQSLIKIVSTGTESSDMRAMAAMVLHTANQEKVEDRVRLFMDYTRNIYGAPDAQIADRSAKKQEVANWFVDRMKKEADASVENPRGKSADEVRGDKLSAAVILRGLGKLNPEDKDPILSAEAYNAKLLDCITRPGGDNKKRELMLPKDRPELVADIIGALNVANLSTAERQTLLSILDLPTNSNDAKANNAAEKAKISVLAMLPQMIGGTSDADIELRLQARAKMQANLDPDGKMFAGDRPILRMALCAAAGEAGMDDPKTVALLKKTFDLDPKDQTFFEQSPLVRRAALEALAATSRNDAIDIAKRLKDKDEKDPAVARRAAAIADLARIQSGGLKDREEIRQDVIFRLADKAKCNSDDGKSYLESSRFKILNWADFVEAWRKVRVDAEPGQGSLLSLSRGWARVSNFDYNIPEKMMDAASTDLERTRSKMPTDLVNVAKNHTDPAEARKAILALSFALETKAESFATNTADSQKIKNGMQVLFAQGLRDLCGKEVTYMDGDKQKNETIANKHRLLVATIAENFVTGSQQIDWQARYHLYEGLKTLRKDGAISPADYAEILTNALHAPIKNQTFPTDQRQINWCKHMYAQMMNELVELQPRDEKTLGLLKGIADGLKKQPGWEDTARRAATTYGMLMDSPMPTFAECRDKGSVDTPDALAQRLDKAYQDYREGLAVAKTQEEIRKNRDNLVRAIFKCTEGVADAKDKNIVTGRMTDLKDPRIKLLMQIGFNSNDCAVKQAVAIAFQRTDCKDGFLPLIGRTLYADVLRNGTDYQKEEVQRQFDLKVKSYEELAKKDGKDPAVYRKNMLDAIEYAKTLADSKANGMNISAKCFQMMTSNRIKEVDPEKVDRNALLATKRTVEDLLAKPNVRADEFTWAMMDMMYQGTVIGDDPRLAVTRKVLATGTEQQKIATAFATLFYDHTLPDSDRDLAVSTLIALKDKATNPVVKAEAERYVAAFEKLPRMEPTFKRVRAK